jgi:hypothetical protein
MIFIILGIVVFFMSTRMPQQIQGIKDPSKIKTGLRLLSFVIIEGSLIP